MASPPLPGGPVPPFNNPVPTPQYYQPRVFAISNIALGATTIVTTTVAMDYVVGQLVRLVIPEAYGCYQLNQQTGYVISLPSANQVEIAIFSIGGNPYRSITYPTPAQIVAVGEINNGFINNSGRVNQGTYIPGSFINISPV
jgi:hypothetical protein